MASFCFLWGIYLWTVSLRVFLLIREMYATRMAASAARNPVWIIKTATIVSCTRSANMNNLDLKNIKEQINSYLWEMLNECEHTNMGNVCNIAQKIVKLSYLYLVLEQDQYFPD